MLRVVQDSSLWAPISIPYPHLIFRLCLDSDDGEKVKALTLINFLQINLIFRNVDHSYNGP